ncbi:hypothetical protein B7463_g3787, partial [Scytalidium lignicola]
MARIKKKGTTGSAKNFITRTQAVRKLQISLPDFRKLCIWKGIYPREPRNKKKASKSSTPSTTFYYTKDIQYLLHEPLLKNFREQQALEKKISKALGRGDAHDAQRLERNASRPEKSGKSKYSLDHLIRERYPTFADALRDLDDCLSMLFLFANLPSTSTVPAKMIARCERLCLEFEHYLIASHSLNKSFLSIKGIYYQATIQGQDILWLVPYKFNHRVTGDVDFRIMGTFIEFYQTLLGFINFRLYTSIGLVYPPKFDANRDDQGAELGAFSLEGNSLGPLKPQPQITSSEATQPDPKLQAEIDKLMSQLNEKDRAPETIQETTPNSNEEETETDKIDKFEPVAPGGDILLQPSYSSTDPSKLFANFTFFLSRETPRQPLEFLLRAFGCKRIGWDAVLGEGAFTHNELDPSITHQIVDRPPIQVDTENEQQDTVGDNQTAQRLKAGFRVPGRIYVQPQWVWDCVNDEDLKRPDLYAPGAQLPPHLSPFVKKVRGQYDPTVPLNEQEREGEELEAESGEEDVSDLEEEVNPSRKQIASHDIEIDATAEGMDVAGSEDDSNSAEEDSDSFGGFSDAEEEDDDDEATSSALKRQLELEAELTGVTLEEEKADPKAKAKTDARKKAAQKAREEEEELERAKMMMSRKKRKILEKMIYSNKKKDAEAEALRAKRRKIEKAGKGVMRHIVLFGGPLIRARAMTSIPNTTHDASIPRDALSKSHVERRPASSTFSNSGNRFSIGSSETGESSTAASNLSKSPLDDEDKQEEEDALLDYDTKLGDKDGRHSHRSHKSKSNGGFLLSHTLFDTPPGKPERTVSGSEKPPRDHTSMHDAKGKWAVRSMEKRHSKRISSDPTRSGGSPLAVHVASLSPGLQKDIRREETEKTTTDHQNSINGSKPSATALDVDSAQIVNVALKLSESRRNASRRNISTPLPPPGPFVEGFAGRSLRQTLQQQRRSSRTVSPKPDHGDRALTASPRLPSAQKAPGSLQSTFDSSHTPSYEYHFSASTLARAERAKNEFELMAQYRRLLQYLPPLTSNASQSVGHSGISSEPLTSPTYPANRTLEGITHPQIRLGRLYNPLQYIRNRKVRARERRSIDGEAQGFGDVEKVTAWVDEVANLVSSHDPKVESNVTGIPALPLPSFLTTETVGASHSSPQSAISKTQVQGSKFKRPRFDWIIHAPDLLADLVWLEQDDNKRAIEDSHGGKIFPQLNEPRRPVSRRTDEPERLAPIISIPVQKDEPPIELRLDTKLPEFKSIKVESDNLASRARHALHDAAHLHHSRSRSHNRNRSANNPILFLSPSRSDSDESDSDNVSRRRRRSGTVESQDMSKNLLEKQMMDILANQIGESGWSTSHDLEVQAAHNRKSKVTGNDQSGSEVIEKHELSKNNSPKNGSATRASLEVPVVNPRTSLEGFDSTAPNSPQARPSRMSRGFIPSIAIDLSPPTSRDASPTRTPLSKVRSKISKFREHSRERSRVRGSRDEGNAPEHYVAIESERALERPAMLDTRGRSPSPVKQSGSRKTEESLRLSKTGSLKRGKLGEETSGIKALFKGSRGPVNRVTDLIRKKDAPPRQGNVSGFSTDDSDFEDAREAQPYTESRRPSFERSNSTSQELEKMQSPRELPSYLKEMPTFKSPFDHRRPAVQSQVDESENPEVAYVSRQQPSRNERQESTTSNLLELPSSDTNELLRQGSRPDSDISELESRRGSSVNGARLNAILGIPGRGRGILPVTGLAKLDMSSDRPSLRDKRQWSISDRAVSVHRGPMTKREIARVRTLLLSSGIKAKEITRRAAEAQDLRTAQEKIYVDIANLAQKPIPPVSKSSEHVLAVGILQEDIQISVQAWEAATNMFCGTTMNELIHRLDNLQIRVGEELIPMARKAGDDADEVSRDLVMNQTLAVKRLEDAMNKMIRRRRRKFRWLRRGGWVFLEWALVGVMCHASQTQAVRFRNLHRQFAVVEPRLLLSYEHGYPVTTNSNAFIVRKPDEETVSR